LDADAVVPLPYIANTAGWMNAELGRQHWLIYGLRATPPADLSARGPRADALFT